MTRYKEIRLVHPLSCWEGNKGRGIELLKGKYYLTILLLTFLLMMWPPSVSHASVCSKVSMEILQELTMERIAFDAKMVITNNIPDKNLANIRVDVTIKDNDGNVKNDLFYVRVSSMSNISSVYGSGVVKAATSAEIHWLIIPSSGAGGSDPSGEIYWVGATLTYTVDDKAGVISVNPDKITVKPEAQLVLDYFVPYEVLGDNPFTQVEAPVPFPLAVRVMNTGFGPAYKLKIDSAQPKIVDNAQGLLVDFRLLGAAVNDSAVSPSLTVDIGTLSSKKIATAYWEMISTLSGRFTEFSVSFSHASELGGELTSLLKETNAHYFIRRIKVNLPGRDNRLDFLADTDRDPDHLPDAIFESEIPGDSGNVEDSISPVTVVAVIEPPQRPTHQAPNVELKVRTGDSGWVYARLSDPADGMLKILNIIRADGVHLDSHNFWISETLDSNYRKIYTLHLVDYRSDSYVTGSYALVFAKPEDDVIPPGTTLLFNGPSRGTDPVYITPETNIIFTSTDNEGGSGVDQMFRKVVGVDSSFVPAFPMHIDSSGYAELEYYSLDRAGNKEAVRTTMLYIDNAAPVISSFAAVPSVFMPNAPASIAAPKSTEFTFSATDEISRLEAKIDIARGGVFATENVVRSFDFYADRNTEVKAIWDGRDRNGLLVPTGTYTARLSVTDGLDGGTVSHTSNAEINVTVDEWFKGEGLDPNFAGEQKYPEISGLQVVWQDNRSGNWDIYTTEINTESSYAVTNHPSDQIRPSIDGNIVVWQDSRNGSWDIYGYDLIAAEEFVISADVGNQERPVISGEWVAWQDDRGGNWDIYAYRISSGEQIRLTSHERDQLHPAISGDTVVWEDYRHGLGEIYAYDLVSGIETRHTFNIYNQTLPAVSASSIAWTDQRNGQRDIYFSGHDASETRVTYGTGDHSQSALMNDIIIYTDYEAGIDDPNLAFFDFKQGIGDKLTANPARQEEPAADEGVLVWQDDRDGIHQIYWAYFSVEALSIEAEIRPGFNLIAVGEKMASLYPRASDLIASGRDDLNIEKVVTYNSLNGIFMESSEAEIILSRGMGIGIYASGNGFIETAESGEKALYTFLPGDNYVGVLTVPHGYTSYNLLQSVGFDSIQSVRKFNNRTGSWETAALRETHEGIEMVGVNFSVLPGDGLIITMKMRIDGWKP
jgi:beta propeller repeat protein